MRLLYFIAIYHVVTLDSEYKLVIYVRFYLKHVRIYLDSKASLHKSAPPRDKPFNFMLPNDFNDYFNF